MTAGTDSSRDEHAVARYYDSNTRRFLALGGGGGSHSIHRALWGPGIRDGASAANYIHVLLGDAIESLELERDPEFIDLGCGVGGSMFALAQRFSGTSLHGVTISEHQCEMARRFAGELGLSSNCQFHCGDFESIDLGIEADAAIAVESMVHARSISAFLANASRHLKSDGTLFIVDDFIALADAPNPWERKVLDDFRNGWRLSSLSTVADFSEAATTAGFEIEETRDLSSMIQLNRPRDRVIAAITPFLRYATAVPMFANLVGGAALTRGMRAGILGYYWLRLRKSRPSRSGESS